MNTKENTVELEFVDTQQICFRCGAARSVEKKRDGWTMVGRKLICDECKADYFITRTASLPVDSVNIPTGEFESLVVSQLDAFTDAVNWCLREFELRDPGLSAVPNRSDVKPKLPPYKDPYLYNEIRERWPNIKPASVSCLCRRAWALYGKLRYGVIAKNNIPARVKYPHPIIIRADAWDLNWKADDTGDEHPHVEFTLGGTDVSIRLHDHPRDFSRQITLLRKIQSGEAKGGDLTLYLNRIKYGASTQHCIRTGDGVKRGFFKVNVNIAITFTGEVPAAFQMQFKPNPDKEMLVETARDCFYVLTSNGYTIHRRHDTHLLRLIQNRERRLLELSEDRKWCNSNRRRRLLIKSQAESDRYNRRIDNSVFCHAKDIVKAAVKCGCGTIALNKEAPKITDRYQWFNLFKRVADNCAEFGIRVVEYKVRASDENEDDLAPAKTACETKERHKAGLKEVMRRRKSKATRAKTAETSEAIEAFQRSAENMAAVYDISSGASNDNHQPK